MAESYERLGLEIHLKTTDTFKQLQGLLDKLNSVQQALGAIGKSASTDGLGNTTNRIKTLVKVTGESAENIKKLSQQIADDKYFTQFAKGIMVSGAKVKESTDVLVTALNRLFTTEFAKRGGKIVAAIKAIEKAEIQAAKARTSAHKENEKSLDSLDKKQREINAAYASRNSNSTTASGKKILSPEEAWAAMDDRKATQVKASRKEQAEVARKTLSEIEKYERSAAAAAKESADAQIGAMRRINAERKAQQKIDTRFAVYGENAKGVSDSVSILAQKYPRADLTNIRNQIADINKLIAAGGDQKALDAVRVKMTALGNSLKIVREQAKSTAESTNMLNLGLSKMTERLMEFYSIRAILFAVSTQIREAVAGILDLSQAVHDVAAVSGAGREQLSSISESIMDIAKSSRYTAKEVGELMQILAQAGVAAEILPEVSKQVGIFATATASAPDLAADVVTTAMNTFRINADEVTRITNAMTAALNESKLSTDGLATAFNYLAPQASQLGYSLEETLGIVAQMAQSGVKPSTIGTGVSQMLKEFAAPKARLRKLLDHYKIDADEINPRFNSFDAIVNTLQQKGVAVEHLFQALETRVGRSVVTAVTQGAAAFKYMTDSITGTNSAAIAYEKAMEGARARLNVLKMEFMQFVLNIGNVAGPVLSGLLSGITGVVKALNSWEGQTVLLSSAVLAGTAVVYNFTTVVATLLKISALAPVIQGITTAVKGMQAALLMPVTPAMLAIVGAVAALGVTIAATSSYFKLYNDELTHSDAVITQLTRSVQKQHDHEQMLNLLSKDNYKAIKELNEAEKAQKTTKDELNRLKGKEIELTDQSRAARAMYIAKNPEYREALSKEGFSVGNLTEMYRKLNAERLEGHRAAIAEINTLNKTILKAKENAKDVDTTSYGEGNLTAGVAASTYGAAARKAEERRQKLLDSGAIMQHRLDTDKNGNLIDVEPQKKKKEEKPAKDIFGSGKTGAAAKRTEALDRNINLELAESKIRMLKIEAETAKLDKEQAEIDLKRTGDLADYKTKAKIAIEKEYAAKESEGVLRILKEEAQALKGKVNVFYKTDGSIDWGKTNVTKGKEVTPGQEKAIRAQFSQEIANKRRATELEKGNALDNISIKFPAVQSSDNAEKHADKLLRINTSRIALAKEQAYTTREVLELEKEQVALEMTSYQIKKEAFEKEVKELEAQRAQAYQQEVGDAWDKQNLQNLDVKKEKLEEILQLIEQQRIKQQEADDTSPMGQLKRGMKDSWGTYAKEADDFKKLGAKLTTDGLDGMTNSLNNMVDAITSGGNAWRAFRNTLGEVMKGIADELQKYIMQMLVVYAVQKLIGFAMNSIGGGEDAASWGGYADVGAPGSWGGTFFKDGGIIQPLLFARGGAVPSYLGTKGKDSVPAWLMPEEYVINADAVRYYGVDFFEKANKKRLASGGIVSSGSASAGGPSMGDSEGKPVTLQIINLVDPNTIPKTTDEQIINVISLDAMKNGPSIRTIKAVLSGR